MRRATTSRPITRIDAAFQALETPSSGTAELQLADGRRVSAALLVGADGANSAVRAAAGINAELKPYRQTALVANFECERPHLNTAWQWFTDEGIVALLPMPGNRVSLVWSAPEALAPQLQALDPAAFAERVAARSRHVLGILDAARRGARVPAAAAHRRGDSSARRWRSSATRRTWCIRWRARASTSACRTSTRC